MSVVPHKDANRAQIPHDDANPSANQLLRYMLLYASACALKGQTGHHHVSELREIDAPVAAHLEHVGSGLVAVQLHI